MGRLSDGPGGVSGRRLMADGWRRLAAAGICPGSRACGVRAVAHGGKKDMAMQGCACDDEGLPGRSIEPVARIRTPYPTKFGVPRQPGLADAIEAQVVFEPAYRNVDAVRGLETFGYVWLLWEFSHNRREGWTPTVRPPRLGGTQRMGVFATRSSFRPNGIGLSCVRLVGIDLDCGDAPVLRVTGADMVDGTPVYDIKPYLPFCDSHPDAGSGWIEDAAWEPLAVEVPPAELAKVPEDLRAGLVQMLRQDPRPAYTRTGRDEREFWVPFGTLAVRFLVEGGRLDVTRIVELDGDQMERLRRTGTVELG